MPTQIDNLLDEFVDEQLDDSPTFASTLGAEGYDDRLDDLSAGAFEARAARDELWIRRFGDVPDDDLALDERIDRDLVLSTLRGRAIMRDWEGWRRSADTYLSPGLYGVFTLFLQRLRPEPELAASAAARLRGVPELLDHGRANLKPELANPVLVRRALGQCQAAIRYARDLVPAEVEDAGDRALVAEAGEVAAAAYESFAVFLDELATAATGDYAVGEARYSALLRERELLGLDAATLRERGRAAWDELALRMDEVAARIDGERAGWRDAVERLNDDHPSSPEAMRAAYEDWTERARAYLREHELVTLPEGEQCLVEPSPPFQRPVLAVASYNRPPAFRDSRVGHFFVPFPPDGTPADEVRKRLQTNNHSIIPSISVHEAYPGHHWHLSWAKSGTRRVRHIIGTSFFVEGWALYAELMMSEQGFFADDRQVLGWLDSRIFRAARIVVDTSLHSGEMSFEDAVTFMREHTSLTEPTARAEVGRYCAWPTQASSYLTGSLEIERMRERYLKEGRGTLRHFHDALAGSGMLPLGLAERALFG